MARVSLSFDFSEEQNMRRKITPEELESAIRLVPGEPEKPKRRPRVKGKPSLGGATMANAAARAMGSMKSGAWDGSLGKHFVAYYEILHFNVYGIECGDMTGQVRHVAALCASRMLKEQFGGNENEMAAYMRWTWEREQKLDKIAQGDGRTRRRITWGLQFGGQLLMDYRMAKRAGAVAPKEG